MDHRDAASKRTFMYMDHRIFQMVWRWCRRRHPKKSRKWLKKNYFPHDGHRHWVFTGTLWNQKGQGRPIQLMAAAKVRILRYVKIRSAVNPYDPKWELYLEARLGWQLTQTRTGCSRMEYLWKRQEGRCVVWMPEELFSAGLCVATGLSCDGDSLDRFTYATSMDVSSS